MQIPCKFVCASTALHKI